jgi:DNA-directed RNA polymerase specialized sigma24 family protein
VAARDDGLAAGHSGDLWRLLATITLNKMLKVVRWHTVGRRTVRAEAGPAADADTPTPDGLSPLETLAVLDTLDAVLADVPADRRPIVELRLAGHDLESIAAAVGCSQRTVRRVLDQVKAGLDRLRREDEP